MSKEFQQGDLVLRKAYYPAFTEHYIGKIIDENVHSENCPHLEVKLLYKFDDHEKARRKHKTQGDNTFLISKMAAHIMRKINLSNFDDKVRKQVLSNLMA